MAKNMDEGTEFSGDFDLLKDSRFLCANDIPLGKDTVVTIEATYEHRNMQLRDEVKDVVGTIKFREFRKRLVLNAGHRADLKYLFGNAENAKGKRLAIYVDENVRAFGTTTSAIRFKRTRIGQGPAAVRTQPVRPPVTAPPVDPFGPLKMEGDQPK